MNQYPIIDGRAFVIYDDGSKALRIFAADLAEEVNYILENGITKVDVETVDPVALYQWHEHRLTGGAEPEFRKMPSADVDLSPLRRCRHIETLHLEGNLVNSEVLAEMPCLHTLSIDNHSGTNPIRLDIIPSLRKLWIQKYGKNILGLQNCTGLQALHLWNYAPKCRNLRELDLLKNLNELELIQPRIDSLEGIEQLCSLRSFEVYYSRTLKDVSSLDNCAGLEKVVLEHVPKIKPPSKNDIGW